MDSPLSRHGRENLRDWAAYLAHYQWNRILSSDLGRAKETTAILNATLGLPVTFESRLRELHWGEWEGRTIKDIKDRHPAELEHQIASGWDFRAPGGESRREVLVRAKAALLEAASRRPRQKILVVCHQGIIKCLIFDILDTNFVPGESPSLDNNSLHTITCAKGSFACEDLNISPFSRP
jgi:probable phosphoglycerate mutase